MPDERRRLRGPRRPRRPGLPRRPAIPGGPTSPTAVRLRKTATRAQREVKGLLKKSHNGTLTQQQLDGQLADVSQRLGTLISFIHK